VNILKKAAFFLFAGLVPVALSAEAVNIVADGASFCDRFAVGKADTRSLDGEWKFLHDNAEKTVASSADFDDSGWQTVTVPHDWAIAGPFNRKGDCWLGKLPWHGAGWYRRSFGLSADEAQAFAAGERTAYLEFDGVMARPEVFVNGVRAGGWNYGYLGFALDVTKLLKAGANVIAVKASTKQHSSRWYPGGGLYRSVRFVSRPRNHVLPGSLAITTEVRGLSVADGTPRAESAVVTVSYEASEEGPKKETFEIAHPRLWDVCRGETYALDLLGERFTYGIRDIRLDADEGLILNGRRVQLQGVNLHSDFGPLGVAFDRDAMKRQLLLMRDMGANAIRTSHNPPDPQMLALCDEMGFLVWDECFDKWNHFAGRLESENLEEYVCENLRRFVCRDRNHPSVFCWSIGNEINPIRQNGTPSGMTNDRFKTFRAAIRSCDATRAVSIACCSGLGKEVDFRNLDLIGWNYGGGYRWVHEKCPGLPVLCSESASTVSEYGFYEQPPALDKMDYARDTLQVGSYDHNAAPWSDIPDVEFDRLAADRFCCGEFVWTGIDYLGEPTPIVPSKDFGITNSLEVCARSSYFGAADLCGFPKDRFYLYRSLWNRSSETVHVLPHWNWHGREGENVPVYVYTSGDEAELFLNGRSLGRRRKDDAVARVNLARMARLTVSSEECRKGAVVHPGKDAVDASPETRWCAANAETNQWIQLDFGERKAFNVVALKTEHRPGRYGYVVELSDDGASWRPHFRKALEGTADYVRKETKARYVRITFTELTKGTPASIRTLEVNEVDETRVTPSPYYDVCSKYRLRWLSVPYEPGELKAVAYRGGQRIGERTVRTAGAATTLRLTDDPFNPPEAKTRFVQVEAVDAQGVRHPLSMANVRFSLEGPGKIVAVGNGNPKGLEAFGDTSHHSLFYGKAAVVVRRAGKGPIVLRAASDGLAEARLTLE